MAKRTHPQGRSPKTRRSGIEVLPGASITAVDDALRGSPQIYAIGPEGRPPLVPSQINYHESRQPTEEETALRYQVQELRRVLAALLPQVITPKDSDDEIPLDREALAIGVLVKHPEWEVTKIAETAGVHRATLYRSRTFSAALKLCQGTAQREFLNNVPKGARTVDRHNKKEAAEFEAWEEPEKDDEE
jgi:hypothetical protein